MTTISINNKNYELEALSDEVKAELASLQFTNAEIQRLEINLAVLKTAKSAYEFSINKKLPA
jgi:hypothetical protein